MVAPIVLGILRRNVSRYSAISDGSGLSIPYSSYVDYVVGSKQAKPANGPLPYFRKTATAAWQGNVFWNVTLPSAEGTTDLCDAGAFNYQLNVAYNKAYEKLKEELLSGAQLGATLAEMGQACEMITNRATQILNIARAIKTGNFRKLKDNLTVFPPSRVGGSSRLPKKFGDAWLEYHFGWEPLLKDMYEASEVLVRPVKTLWGRSRSTQPLPRQQLGNNGHPYYISGNASVNCQTGIKVINENVVYANGLGLLNPAAIAWELVPFSFVVDWFTSFGSVINSMTDYLGMDLINPAHTKFIRFRWDYARSEPYPPGYVGSYFARSTGNTVWLSRQWGLPGPTILVRPAKIPSLTRAATATALLAGFLR